MTAILLAHPLHSHRIEPDSEPESQRTVSAQEEFLR
jgi:hypothetical protein